MARWQYQRFVKPFNEAITEAEPDLHDGGSDQGALSPLVVIQYISLTSPLFIAAIPEELEGGGSDQGALAPIQLIQYTSQVGPVVIPAPPVSAPDLAVALYPSIIRFTKRSAELRQTLAWFPRTPIIITPEFVPQPPPPVRRILRPATQTFGWHSETPTFNPPDLTGMSWHPVTIVSAGKLDSVVASGMTPRSSGT